MENLNEIETAKKELQKLRRTDAFVNEALLELDRILRSRAFKRVQLNARTFLHFVVAMKLLGRSDETKEMTIAIFVYGEPPSFDPLVSRKVAVAAKALRKRLARYYATEGKNDPIKISIPKGTYVPELRDRRVSIEVSDFRNSTLHDAEDHLCQAMPAEITRSLNGVPWVRAKRTQVPTVGAAGFSCWLSGCLESSDEFVWLYIRFGHLQTGAVICWRSFIAHRCDAITLAHDVARVIIQELRSFVDADSTAPKPHRPRSAA